MSGEYASVYESRAGRLNVAGWRVTRCEFMKASCSALIGICSGAVLARAEETRGEVVLSFGIVTDSHYADTARRGKRCYRESVKKMNECVALMNEKRVDFLIELGDFKDECRPVDEKETLRYLDTIEAAFGKFNGPRYHAIGNHDVDSISKEQFLAHIENTGVAKGSKYYSFDSKGVHFIVLDANFTEDGVDHDHGEFDWAKPYIPDVELGWLRKDLSATSLPVIVFVHQQLDGSDHNCVRNAAQIRKVLQERGTVLAVFHGHNHAGHYSCVEGIHYYTLKAMVEESGEKNSSYAVVEVCADSGGVVTGYRRAVSMEMQKV